MSGHLDHGDRCGKCGQRIYWYIHSQAGPLKAGAWTTVPADSETDQRFGTTCTDGRRHGYPEEG